jgi:hypothetical protein
MHRTSQTQERAYCTHNNSQDTMKPQSSTLNVIIRCFHQVQLKQDKQNPQRSASLSSGLLTSTTTSQQKPNHLVPNDSLALDRLAMHAIAIGILRLFGIAPVLTRTGTTWLLRRASGKVIVVVVVVLVCVAS